MWQTAQGNNPHVLLFLVQKLAHPEDFLTSQGQRTKIMPKNKKRGRLKSSRA